MQKNDRQNQVEQALDADKSIDAMVSPSPLTISRMAILEKLNLPILRGDLTDPVGNIVAIWACEFPIAEVSKGLRQAQERALEWGEELSTKEFQTKLKGVFDGIVAFWDMLPRPDESQKKTADDMATGS